MNKNKPIGPSIIPAWALKDCIIIFAEPLCFLINAFIEESRFPNHLKSAFVIPIFKKSDCENLFNYRPISITPALAKLFEKILHEQISEYLSQHKLLSNTQYGFRRKFSTTDALLYATENIRKKVIDKEVVCAAFLDLSKAFDSISRDILLEKLKALNFDSNAVSMINSFLRFRIQKVILPSCTSDWIQLYQGVPQGSVLGPLLFNIYVNSLYTCIDHKCSVVQYADDTMVFTSSKKIEPAVKSLELNVNNICDFFEKHQLTLNADKTEFITFQTKNNKDKNTNLIVKDEVIRSSSTVKFLGVYLDQNLTFQEEVKHILRKMACGIKTLSSIRDYFPEKVRLLLLNALVISHLHYPAILLNGLTENLNTTLEKQLNWGIKACFNRTKYDRSSDLIILLEMEKQTNPGVPRLSNGDWQYTKTIQNRDSLLQNLL